jgi:molecular chaperone GrpE
MNENPDRPEVPRRPGGPETAQAQSQSQADGGTATATPTPGGETLAHVQRERDELVDQLQRSRAEFANYQKRAKSQADADRAYAVGSLARDLLDGLDNLERATEALRASAPAGIAEGLAMVHKQLVATLAKHGVEPIEALGHPFDPNQHEALTQQPDAEHPEGTVVAELGKGYRIRDRVLRPTKVAVSVRPAGT